MNEQDALRTMFPRLIIKLYLTYGCDCHQGKYNCDNGHTLDFDSVVSNTRYYIGKRKCLNCLYVGQYLEKKVNILEVYVVNPEKFLSMNKYVSEKVNNLEVDDAYFKRQFT